MRSASNCHNHPRNNSSCLSGLTIGAPTFKANWLYVRRKAKL